MSEKIHYYTSLQEEAYGHNATVDLGFTHVFRDLIENKKVHKSLLIGM